MVLFVSALLSIAGVARADCVLPRKLTLHFETLSYSCNETASAEDDVAYPDSWLPEFDGDSCDVDLDIVQGSSGRCVVMANRSCSNGDQSLYLVRETGSPEFGGRYAVTMQTEDGRTCRGRYDAVAVPVGVYGSTR